MNLRPFPFVLAATVAGLVHAAAPLSSAMISVGNLGPEQAREMGITMKSRGNGDAGVMVWIEFKKDGFLTAFTYAELRMADAEGKHLVSARLEPDPVVHGQPGDLVSVAFSADPSQLDKCSFLVVAYGSSRGDVGYYLKVSAFIAVGAWAG